MENSFETELKLLGHLQLKACAIKVKGPLKMANSFEAQLELLGHLQLKIYSI
jgi:hypothetical protein